MCWVMFPEKGSCCAKPSAVPDCTSEWEDTLPSWHIWFQFEICLSNTCSAGYVKPFVICTTKLLLVLNSMIRVFLPHQPFFWSFLHPSHYPLNVERVVGKLRVPILKSLVWLGWVLNSQHSAHEANALTTRPSRRCVQFKWPLSNSS